MIVSARLNSPTTNNTLVISILQPLEPGLCWPDPSVGEHNQVLHIMQTVQVPVELLRAVLITKGF